MIAFLERNGGNVLGVKATGKLSHADYQQLVPRLEKMIQEHGKVRVLFDMEDCRGWGMHAAWDDLKFGIKHGGDFDRCAVVGDKKWQEWMTTLSKPFFKLRYFDTSALNEAWQWIQEPLASEKPGAMSEGTVPSMSTCCHGETPQHARNDR